MQNVFLPFKALTILCVRFDSEVEPFVIISFDLRYTDIFFAIFWQFDKRPKSAKKAAKNRFGQS